MAKQPNWINFINLECSTEKEINITSYGDWGMTIKRTELKSLAQPLRDVVEKQIMENYYYWVPKDDEQENQKTVDVCEYPDVQNISQGLSDYVSVEINESENWFKKKYGFWEIEDFKVYEKDGNGCKFSFQTKDHAYIGYYGTS